MSFTGDAAKINESGTELRMAEKEEESKLKAKYPGLQRPQGPQFLQKRLQKGQKFFDSGDYNMAKAAAAKGSGKSRLPESKLNQGHPLPPPAPVVAPVPVANLPPNTTGEAIPTPDCLATRKTSIHVPIESSCEPVNVTRKYDHVMRTIGQLTDANYFPDLK